MVTKHSSNSIQASRSREIRGLASIFWIAFRLENEGNVTIVAKEIIVLIEWKIEWGARTRILSCVAWLESQGRFKRISRILGISWSAGLGRVASRYMVTNKSSNSTQVWLRREIRRFASIGWVRTVARIFRLENEGNVTSVVKEIIVLIECKMEWEARTRILSGVAWLASQGRFKRISRILGISWSAGLGRVASLYMVTHKSSNSTQVWLRREIRRFASIGWVRTVARIFRLENEGNVTSVAKEIIVLFESKLECVVRTGILLGVAWVGSLGWIKSIRRILAISIFTRAGNIAGVYVVTKHISNSIQARGGREIRGLACIVWVGLAIRYWWKMKGM